MKTNTNPPSPPPSQPLPWMRLAQEAYETEWNAAYAWNIQGRKPFKDYPAIAEIVARHAPSLPVGERGLVELRMRLETLVEKLPVEDGLIVTDAIAALTAPPLDAPATLTADVVGRLEASVGGRHRNVTGVVFMGPLIDAIDLLRRLEGERDYWLGCLRAWTGVFPGVSPQDAREDMKRLTAANEALRTEVNDLKNAGQWPFIRSEAIRNLKDQVCGLKADLAASRSEVERLTAQGEKK